MNDFDLAYQRAIARDKRIVKKSMRKLYSHKGRGKLEDNLKKVIVELLKTGTTHEWYFNGEDEYPVDYFAFDKAAEAIVRFLKNQGVAKKLML